MNNRELIYRLYLSREEEWYHAPYKQEFDFYNLVKTGNMKEIQKLKGADFTKRPGLGVLSDQHLQSAKYHFAIAAAMISRYCIDGGMEHELAYSSSDIYINKADKCTSTDELSALQYDMILYYTKYMQDLRTAKIYSPPIIKCIDYIYNNLHTQLSMEILTEVAGLSAGYLSRLFKQETNSTITNYIRDRKIDTAKNMLIHSDYSISMISETLCFASQSYFIKLFKNCTGITPSTYRKYNSQRLEI